MTELVITRGYPASGKSTWATAKSAEPRWARVCRDDLRAMLFDGAGVLAYDQEQQVTAVEHAQVRTLLNAGTSVVVDATHLRLKYARVWADIAAKLGVDFKVQDFPTLADECVKRDWARGEAGGRMVGETVIRDLAQKFPINRWGTVAPRELAATATALLYTPNGDLPSAWMVDLDGTLAQMNGRSPFDWGQVGEDLPITAVVDLVHQLSDRHKIVVMSGRDEVCRDLTADWLYRHAIKFDALFMRPAGDNRKDSIVKAELFDKHVRHNYQVLGVIDDRLQVCRVWHQMGLPLFRAGDPDADF